jgi:chorismate mutase
MRTGTVIFLLIGLALLGWGAWLLYARFVGGPEYYMGKPDETALRDIDGQLAGMREKRAKVADLAAEARAAAEKRPPGDATREKVEQRLAELEKSRAESEPVIVRAEQMRDKIAEQVASGWDDARGRTLHRGLLFTLVEPLWTIRAAAGL